jgi:hypothetical protein
MKAMRALSWVFGKLPVSMANSRSPLVASESPHLA